MTSESHVKYLFKVNLKTAKGIWRTVALRGDHSLHDLHEMILTAYGRYDDHLYSFYFPRARSRRGRDAFQPKEYTSPEVFENSDSFRENGVHDASEAELQSLKLKAGQTFEYLFDFGDSWWHQLKVLSIENVDVGQAAALPVILETHGEAPPQYELEEE